MDCQIRVHYGKFQGLAKFWNGATYYATCWLLYHNQSSGASVTLQGVKTVLHPENLYLLPPGVSFKAESTGDPMQFFLHFDASEPFDHVEQRVYTLPLDAPLNAILQQTMNELLPDPYFLTDQGNMFAVSLAANALARIPKQFIEIEPLDDRVKKAVELLNDEVDQVVSIPDIARRVGMSSGAFSRLFKEQTGTTPYVYMMRMRIMWSCRLLVNTDLPIEVIAEKTGFTDRYHFSKVFKKLIEITPGAYRKQEAT